MTCQMQRKNCRLTVHFFSLERMEISVPMGCYIHNNKWKPNRQQSHNQSSHPLKMKANTFSDKTSSLR